MRVMFIWPGVYQGWNILDQGFEQSAINHGLCAISARLKSMGHECFLMDLRALMGWEHYENVLKQQIFDVAVIGFYSVDERYANQAIGLLRKYFPNKPVIAGGVHLTYGQKEMVKPEGFTTCVTCVWGEGDYILGDLLEMLEAGRAIPEKVIAEVVENLDALPFVDRSLFNAKFEQAHPLFPLLPTPHHTVNFSRGCPYRCTFCLESKNILWKKVRTRSPENCIEEIKTLGEMGSLMIHDDHLPAGKWTERFIEVWDREIGRRIPFWCQIRADWICRQEKLVTDLARIGMTWVSLGIEGSQRMLDFYDKKLTTDEVIRAAEILRQNRVNIFGNYILGAPTETETDLAELESILRRVRPQVHSPSIYTSYPGSLLYDYCAENKLWLEPIDDSRNHYSLVRFPYERKIKGVDYERIFDLRNRWTKEFKSDLVISEQ